MPKNTQVVFYGPQFERPKLAPKPADPPANILEWQALSKASKLELSAMGLRQWNDQTKPRKKNEPVEFGGKTLMLFPAEWFEHIPEGLPLVSIMEREFTFERAIADDDRREGMLAYGVLV